MYTVTKPLNSASAGLRASPWPYRWAVTAGERRGYAISGVPRIPRRLGLRLLAPSPSHVTMMLGPESPDLRVLILLEYPGVSPRDSPDKAMVKRSGLAEEPA